MAQPDRQQNSTIPSEAVSELRRHHIAEDSAILATTRTGTGGNGLNQLNWLPHRAQSICERCSLCSSAAHRNNNVPVHGKIVLDCEVLGINCQASEATHVF